MKKMIYMLGTDRSARAFADNYLKNEGYDTRLFETSGLLFAAAAGEAPSLCLMDLSAQADDGPALITGFRAVSSAPLIVLYQNRDALWRITALTLGADDCLSKEVLPPELSARIKAFFRRNELIKSAEHTCGLPVAHAPSGTDSSQGSALGDLICYGDIVLDLRSRLALCGDQHLELTPNEFDFMSYMIRRASAVRKEELLGLIWGDHYVSLKSRAADDLVKRLRRKLKTFGSSVEIVSIWAYGYRLSVNCCPMQLSEEFHPA
ncbi:MAG: response regulator transcription factor [Eubacteriales bacterium]|nr:response regulator transcription factor [Eubacteriales bacterium]